ncbi:hypothetical protein M3Y97_00633800 [Aphelenchoides bicaudatus]|nr:hypothetical protein M3Y97_00633800 [Aphelenchoides bicaudatus]
MESKTANKPVIGHHCQSECTLSNSQKAPTFNVASDVSGFPRAASRALLEEQNSDEDKIDFSVEEEILKKQRKKEAKLKEANQLKPDEIKHKNSNSSMLDECEDDDESDEIVKALTEIDSTEKEVERKK